MDYYSQYKDYKRKYKKETRKMRGGATKGRSRTYSSAWWKARALPVIFYSNWQFADNVNVQVLVKSKKKWYNNGHMCWSGYYSSRDIDIGNTNAITFLLSKKEAYKTDPKFTSPNCGIQSQCIIIRVTYITLNPYSQYSQYYLLREDNLEIYPLTGTLTKKRLYKNLPVVTKLNFSLYTATGPPVLDIETVPPWDSNICLI